MEVEASSPLRPHTFRHPSWNMESPSRSLAVGSPVFGPKLGGGRLRDKHHKRENRTQSSPTTSLAADLSQNFHIDKTPVIPTPRRSLFSSLNARTLVTTPPIPTSSPGGESMDVSPLPHKAAFRKIIPFTPTDGGSIGRIDFGSLCSSPPSISPGMDPTRRPRVAERKISRPSLLRQTNRLSGGSVSFKTQSSGLPFGKGSPPQINLEELFGGASPEPKKGGLPLKQPFTLGDGNGSPIAPLRSRPNFPKPRGKVRRTLSMFDNPKEVMQSDMKNNKLKICPIPSPNKLDHGENSYLPSFNVKDDPLRRINRNTLVEILDGQYQSHYDEHIVVDCRFQYEYEGGHISGAININSIDVLEEKFFSDLQDKRQLIIFHCEYSAHRAPRMALHLRKRDRLLNMHRYPALNYPDIYILEGGYSSFFNQHKLRCEPQHYVEMDDEKHKRTCEREMSKFRRNTKLTRTQSFTYGALPENHDGSPSTGLASRRSGCGDGIGPVSSRQRRMATY